MWRTDKVCSSLKTPSSTHFELVIIQGKTYGSIIATSKDQTCTHIFCQSWKLFKKTNYLKNNNTNKNINSQPITSGRWPCQYFPLFQVSESKWNTNKDTVTTIHKTIWLKDTNAIDISKGTNILKETSGKFRRTPLIK